ncbi:ribonuclease J [[Mycoplasma] collis]|uniref:ribonuclease J n=1 Tax=[Mycoplasma] collis TaxID=2127 RepID=UPI00051ACFAA|nr:ribonuclease J [[Mycoplasma] collis]
MKNTHPIPTKFFALGGMQEIGKSTLVIEYKNDIVIIDAGIKFADFFASGIKGIIPDYSYLKENQNKIKGLFITHGHEDHIGGVVYLAEQVDIKRIYAPKIAIQYLKVKFSERNIKVKIEFIEINKNDVHKFENLKVDFWTAQHSIPDAFGIRVSSPNGSIMCTGDFRFDYTPIGNFTDFSRLEKIGEEGLDVLLSDSTNAMRPFHSPSEKDILKDIEKYMLEAKRKIIVTTFASNLTRVKVIIELAAKLGKKVIPFGRSMVNGIQIGRKMGYIDAPDNLFINKKNINKYDENELVILTTGSQGEQMSALSRMAIGKHPQVVIKNNDLIIFSSSPIPGNRIKIELLVNKLYKLGATIKENGVDGYLHTSGHAYKEEHEKIFKLTKPKYFVPYHGEFRMSVVHGQTAVENGVNPNNIIIPKLGEVLYLVKHKLFSSNKSVKAGVVFVDGTNISKVNSELIKNRVVLGENGFVYVVVAINKKKNIIVGKPRVISRGCFFVKNSTELVEKIKKLVHGAILFTIKNKTDWTIPELKQLIKDRLDPFFYKEKRRNPVILSTFLFVDEEKNFLKDLTIEKLKNLNNSFELISDLDEIENDEDEEKNNEDLHI